MTVCLGAAGDGRVQLVEKWDALTPAAAAYGRQHKVDWDAANTLVTLNAEAQLQQLKAWHDRGAGGGFGDASSSTLAGSSCSSAAGTAPCAAPASAVHDDVLLWLIHVNHRFPSLYAQQGCKLARAARRYPVDTACRTLQSLSSYTKKIKCLVSLFVGIAGRCGGGGVCGDAAAGVANGAPPTLLLPYTFQKMLGEHGLQPDAAAVGVLLRYPDAIQTAPTQALRILKASYEAADAGVPLPPQPSGGGSASSTHSLAVLLHQHFGGGDPHPPAALPAYTVRGILSVTGTDKLPRPDALLPSTLDWLATLSAETTRELFERYATYAHQVRDANKLLRGIAQRLGSGRGAVTAAAALPPSGGDEGAASDASSSSRTEATLPGSSSGESDMGMGASAPAAAVTTPPSAGATAVAVGGGATSLLHPDVEALLSHYPAGIRADVLACAHAQVAAAKGGGGAAAATVPRDPIAPYARAIVKIKAHLTPPVRTALADLLHAKDVHISHELLAELARYPPSVIVSALRRTAEYGGRIKKVSKFIRSVLTTVQQSYQRQV